MKKLVCRIDEDRITFTADAEKSEFHEPKHGKRKKREIVLWKREVH